jgi:hypothetical protein
MWGVRDVDVWGVRDVFYGRASLARMCAEGAAAGEDASGKDEGANMFGDSPLHLAAEQGHVSTIQVRPCSDAHPRDVQLCPSVLGSPIWYAQALSRSKLDEFAPKNLHVNLRIVGQPE